VRLQVAFLELAERDRGGGLGRPRVGGLAVAPDEVGEVHVWRLADRDGASAALKDELAVERIALLLKGSHEVQSLRRPITLSRMPCDFNKRRTGAENVISAKRGKETT
jgi:hypothetical protein